MGLQKTKPHFCGFFVRFSILLRVQKLGSKRYHFFTIQKKAIKQAFLSVQMCSDHLDILSDW